MDSIAIAVVKKADESLYRRSARISLELLREDKKTPILDEEHKRTVIEYINECRHRAWYAHHL